MNQLLSQAKAIESDIVADRRHIHQNPEIGMDLPNTTKYVCERLTQMGYTPTQICKSGVVATVGKPGKTILLRGDMDALPEVMAAIAEHDSLAYCRARAQAYARDAEAALLDLPDNAHVAALRGLAHYAVSRDH